jgi:RecB family exonuclease
VTIDLTRMSYSRWKSYTECPLAWRYHYIDNLPTVERHYFSFGHTIHDCLEQFVKPFVKRPVPGEPMSLPYLLELYRNKWERGGYRSADEEYRYFDDGIQILTRFYEDYMARQPKPLLVEHELTTRLDGFGLVGILDRVDVTDNAGLDIIDYKTTKQLSMGDVAKSDQLTVYQILAAANLDLPVESLTLYHLPQMRRLTVPARPPEVVEDVVRRMGETVDAIRSGVFEPKVGLQCRNCDYLDRCPAWADKRPKDPEPVPTP